MGPGSRFACPGRQKSRASIRGDILDCFAALAMTEFVESSSRTSRGPMQYRQLGRSGLKVSQICLGSMMFGGPTDEAASRRIIAKAREAGVNFIDTADAYSKGGSEEVVGRAIAD